MLFVILEQRLLQDEIRATFGAVITTSATALRKVRECYHCNVKMLFLLEDFVTFVGRHNPSIECLLIYRYLNIMFNDSPHN